MLALAEQDYKGEYLAAVNTYLFRHATLPASNGDDEERRTYCYVIASRVANY